jgi:hypothetical protein
MMTFSGKKEDYTVWRAKFLSYAQFKGCKKVLTGVEVPPKDSDVLVVGTDDAAILVRKSNERAYSMLMIAVKDSVSFSAVHNARSTDLDGDATQALKNLDAIFSTKNSATKHELQQQFNNSRLTKEERNPDEWFAELEKIKLQLDLDYKDKIDPEKMISHILYNCKPKIYNTVITVIKRELGAKTTALTDDELISLKNDLRQIYAQRSFEKNDDKHEKVLAVQEGKRRFKKPWKGDCRLCGKKGHKAIDCWESEKNKAKRPPNYKGKTTETAAAASEPNRAKMTCTYCKKNGHTAEVCWKKEKDEKKKTTEAAEVVIVAIDLVSEISLINTEKGISKNIFIADSGATSHMRNSLEGMYDLEDWVVGVKVGNNSVMKSQKRGKFKGLVKQQDGATLDVLITDVLYVPELFVNLISLVKVISNPNNSLNSDKEGRISLTLGKDSKITFDTPWVNGSGKLLGVEIIPINNNLTESNVTAQTYEHIHEILGHPGEQTTKATAKRLGINVKKGPVDTCVNCAISKAKQKKVPQVSKNQATEKGERIAIDISSIRTKSFGGSKFWLMIQDEFTGYIWSHFLKNKSDLPDVVIKWIHLTHKKDKVKVQKIRCDNAGENKSLQKQIEEDKELDIKFEFTAPYTPEMNGKIERKFATLYGKTRSILNGARLTKTLREGLWAQCAKLATKLENILCGSAEDKSPAEKFYGELPKWVKKLKVFGEVAIISDDKNKAIRGKLSDRGFPALFIGYPDDHSNDVFEFFNFKTRSVLLSRNVIWLNQVYGDYMKITNVNTTKIEDSEDEEDFIEKDTQNKEDNIELVNNEENEQDGQESDDDQIVKPIPNRLAGEVKRLTCEWNPNPMDHAELAMLTQVFDLAYSGIAGFDDGSNIPKTYNDAKKHPDWKDWWSAMYTELNNMETKGVWEITKRNQVPNNRKIIGNRWVFAKKDDGRFRARTVAKGFSQIPGQDFQENHAPVVNDTTFHLVLSLKILFGLEAGQFDIETAFLYGDLEETLWMEFPQGYEEFLKEKHNKIIEQSAFCLLLKKALYGLVQAARQWWKKFKEIMATLSFYPSMADPCLFVKKSTTKEVISFVILYVDDGGIIGTKEIIDKLVNALSKDFKVKYLGEMEHFVGCHLIQSVKKDIIWIHQPKLLKNLKEHFGEMVKEKRVYKTPGAPKTVIIRPMKDDPLISVEDQKKFRSGVGMLLYLVKHSRPDIANAVRELSKVADGATQAHWKAMMRVIKFVIDTENYGLKIKPYKDKKGFHLEGICDSEYAGDKDSRISVYGYILYFCGAPVAWKSKAGRSVTLSSTEAEYFAVSEIAKEAIFIKQVLESMNINFNYPIEIKVDNVGAIYLANNYATSQRTKHIDIRAHFVREFIEDGIIKVVFVKSEDNDADIFTKNPTEELFKKHSIKNVEEVNLS